MALLDPMHCGEHEFQDLKDREDTQACTRCGTLRLTEEGLKAGLKPTKPAGKK